MPHDEKLIDFINETIPQRLQVEEDLGYGYVRLNITEAHRRQAKDDIRCAEDIIVELLRNSRDAKAKNIYIAAWKQENLRNIAIFDDGEGIPEVMVNKIFEARVTSKLNKVIVDQYGVHGRGMALYSIALNCHEAKFVLSKKGEGSVIKIVIDTNILPEKTNQSTWPSFNSKGIITKGPNNLIRKAIEFNIKASKIKVFFGSPAEIVARLNNDKLFFTEKKANEIKTKAENFGLDISFRNCQRIVYKEIEPIKNILSRTSVNEYVSFIKKRNYELPISKEDLNILLTCAVDAINKEADKYYLRVSENASINKVGNALKINLPLENVQ